MITEEEETYLLLKYGNRIEERISEYKSKFSRELTKITALIECLSDCDPYDMNLLRSYISFLGNKLDEDN